MLVSDVIFILDIIEDILFPVVIVLINHNKSIAPLWLVLESFRTLLKR